MKTLKLVLILAMVLGLAAGLMVWGGPSVMADNPTGPVMFLPFDTPEDAPNAFDLTDHGNDGELKEGAAYTGSDAPVPGSSNAVVLDGTDDYVEVDDDSSLDTTTNHITIAG